MQRALTNALGAHWRLFMFQGTTMIFLGVIAVILPVTTTLAIERLLGWLFMISGIIGLTAILSAYDAPAFLWSLVTGALLLAFGALLVLHAIESAVSMTVVLAAFFIVEAIFQVATSVAYRLSLSSAWGWMLVSGIADLLLAAIILSGWPISGVWAAGLLAGVNLITSGLAVVMVGAAGRAWARTMAETLVASQY